jgi:hypothetical protein
MSFRNSAFTRLLAFLVAVAMINVTAFAGPAFSNRPEADPYNLIPALYHYDSLLAPTYEVITDSNPLGASADKSFEYGLDVDRVPFAQKANGTKGRFLELSPQHYKLQIVRGSQLGEVEFTRLSADQTLTRFKTGGKDDLFVFTTKSQAINNGPTRINILFQYKTERVNLNIDNASSQKSFSPASEKKLQALLANINKNRRLTELMGDSKVFSDKSVLSGVMSAGAYSHAPSPDSLACIIAAGECILIIATYVGSIGALIALCPETIGASCLGALLLHPVIAVLVAAKCADALQKCGIAPPPVPSKAAYQAACLAFGGSWNASSEECISLPLNLPTPGTCRGWTNYISYPTSGCITGLTFGYPCNRSAAFRSRCDDYDDENCVCIGGMSMSPIVIDVDHSGFSMSDAAGGVVFNILNDGVPLPISWTAASSTNAFLVLDRNGNGTIDGGEELFGNTTPQPLGTAAPNGFIALAEYDKAQNGGNGNGRIENDDSVFTQLRLWQDVNHNGISESNELHPLPELGIKAIGLDYKESKRTDLYGNKFRYRAKVYDANGTHAGRWAWDVFFVMK